MPLTFGDRPVIPPRRNADRAALLLASADFVRKGIIGDGMIELRCRLVEPRAPCNSTVLGDQRSLVGNQKDDVRVVGIDPQVLVVITTGCAAPALPGLPAVDGL